jgi:hypothetical protein
MLSAITLASLLVTGCKGTEEPEPATAKPPTHAQGTEDITVEATVLAVDPDTREITLRGEDGQSFVVVAGPAVANFAQVAVGDKLRVRYQASIAVALKAPGAAITPASASASAEAAELGKKPGAKIEDQVTATVRIESVDTERNIVVVTPPGGGLRAIHVVRPEGREFIKGLKPGDLVEITYSEALAFSIETL